MLACVLKNRLSSRLVTRSVSAFFQRRAFSENAESVEYEIVKNMETFPLFSEKINYVGKKETSLKYFKGSDWMKASDKLCFNADAVSLAEHIPGKMDENNNFVVANRFEEHMLATTSTESQFQSMKGEMDTFLASQPSVYVQDGKLGSNERCGIHVRTVTNDPLTALILKSLMFPLSEVHPPKDRKMRNNLTIYVSRGNGVQAPGLEGQLISHGNYTLLVNGDYSIRQLIDSIAHGANELYHKNNRDISDLVTGEASSKDIINTVLVPCSCIRAKNNVSSLLFSSDQDLNVITHEHLDEIHLNAFNTGSLYSLDHTVIGNNFMGCLFGGVQLSAKIGSMVKPTQSVFVNDSILTAAKNDMSCTLPSTLLFIQHATGMNEMNYGALEKLVKGWKVEKDCQDYFMAWAKVCRAECFKISYTIMKDLISEMETIEYNEKEKWTVLKQTHCKP